MKPLYLLTVIYVALTLSGCQSITSPSTSSTKTTATTPKKLAQRNLPKSPTAIAFGIRPHIPYTVLGKGIVSQYNLGGNKRQVAIIHDAMRGLAAKIGGDAVINITHDDKAIEGTIIAYDHETA